MAKFLPVIGELYTTIESGFYVLCAGLAKACGDDNAAEKLVDSAGNAWKQYSETNVLAAPINAMVQDSQGDSKKAMEIMDSWENAALNILDGTPVVGHVKGIVHYAMGDTEKGHRCMESATRSTAVLGVGVATGGVGAAVAVGAGAGVVTGVAYDGLATGIDHAVNGEKAQLRGTFALAKADEMTPEEIFGTFAGIAGDGLAGAGGNQLGRNIRAHVSGQKALQNTYKKSQQLRQTGTHHKTATKVTMDAARESKTAQKAVSKPTKFATSVVEDSITGNQGVGHSGAYRKQYRMENFERLGYDTNTKAAKATGYDRPSHLQAKYEHVEPVLKRPQAACAEHPAFDNMAKKTPNYNPRNVNTASVYNKVDGVNTIKRCDNCQAFGKEMGNVVTDHIPERTPVPTSRYVSDGYVPAASAAVALVVAGKVRAASSQ